MSTPLTPNTIIYYCDCKKSIHLGIVDEDYLPRYCDLIGERGRGKEAYRTTLRRFVLPKDSKCIGQDHRLLYLRG